jgi:hypothetical protein
MTRRAPIWMGNRWPMTWPATQGAGAGRLEAMQARAGGRPLAALDPGGRVRAPHNRHANRNARRPSVSGRKGIMPANLVAAFAPGVAGLSIVLVLTSP